MTAHVSISTGQADLPQLRRRIIGAYRRAHEIVEKASVSSSSRTHGLMHVYEKIYEHMRDDIAKASNSFPNVDALLAWLLDNSEDEITSERDRMGLGLAARTVMNEIEQTRKAL